MKHRFLPAVFLLLLLAGPGGAVAATTVNTSHLRLTFDTAGNLSTAVACFPACSGEQVRIQQFADASVIELGSSGPAAVSESMADGHYELRFQQAGGASHAWRIPEAGYRIELETSGAAELTFRSGEPFRPRPAAGFGNWLEQTRYVKIIGGDVTQIGFDEDESGVAAEAGWVGYRNRYWTLMAQPPPAAEARLAGGADRQDAELRVAAPGAGNWSMESQAGPNTVSARH